jgi:hypothetical protein
VPILEDDAMFGPNSETGITDALARISNAPPPPAHDEPYDIFLQKLCDGGDLNAGAVFPYMTTISGLADESSIQSTVKMDIDGLYNDFRRMMWCDAEYFHTDDTCSIVPPRSQRSPCPAGNADRQRRMFCGGRPPPDPRIMCS